MGRSLKMGIQPTQMGLDTIVVTAVVGENVEGYSREQKSPVGEIRAERLALANILVTQTVKSLLPFNMVLKVLNTNWGSLWRRWNSGSSDCRNRKKENKGRSCYEELISVHHYIATLPSILPHMYSPCTAPPNAALPLLQHKNKQVGMNVNL